MKILKERGITLIALVITIIVLLILAAVTLSLILGDNGIITKADESKTISNQKEVEEQLKLKVQEYLANNDGEFNRAGFLTNLTEFTNNGDNTVTKDGVTLTIGTKGEVAIVINSGNGNEYGTLTKTWDVSENQDGSVTMEYYADSQTVHFYGNGVIEGDNTGYQTWYLIGVTEEAMKWDFDNLTEEQSEQFGIWESKINYDSSRDCNSWEYVPKHIVIDEGLTLRDSAFTYYTTVESVSLPTSVTEIPGYCFQGCRSLTEIKLSNNIVSIGIYALDALANNSTIYCESQAVANLLNMNTCDLHKTTVEVAPEMFE